MAEQRDSRVGTRGPCPRSHTPSVTVAACATLLIAGAGVLHFLPSDWDDGLNAEAASNNMPAAMSEDESFCNKQAWPYVDQRCARRTESARGMRQVRIVTDKGRSVTAFTPLPVVEPKPKAAPAKHPTIARNDRPLGPAAAPTVPDGAPQLEQVVAPQQPPATASKANKQGTEAFASAPARKSRAELRKERKAARREARRRTRNSVPDDVVNSVNEATRRKAGTVGERAVTVESPFDGWRVYTVPAEPQ